MDAGGGDCLRLEILLMMEADLPFGVCGLFMIMARASLVGSLSGLLLLLPLGACAPSTDGQNAGDEQNITEAVSPLAVGAIPDQDPEKVQRLYSKLATYLEAELGVPVAYEPVTDYAAAVTRV